MLTLNAAAQSTDTQSINGQTPGTQATDAGRVVLTESAPGLDAVGNMVFTARLVTAPIEGTFAAPVRNARFIIENRSPAFINYATGRVSFYDAQGARCGDGLFAINAFAAGESVEADAPDLRVTCAPASWRIAITQLISEVGNAQLAMNANLVSSLSNVPGSSASGSNTSSSNAASLIVFISRDNKFFVGGVETDNQKLVKTLADAFSSKSAGNRSVSISLDAEASFASLVVALDAAKSAKAKRIEVMSDGRVVAVVQ